MKRMRIVMLDKYLLIGDKLLCKMVFSSYIPINKCANCALMNLDCKITDLRRNYSLCDEDLYTEYSNKYKYYILRNNKTFQRLEDIIIHNINPSIRDSDTFIIGFKELNKEEISLFKSRLLYKLCNL